MKRLSESINFISNVFGSLELVSGEILPPFLTIALTRLLANWLSGDKTDTRPEKRFEQER